VIDEFLLRRIPSCGACPRAVQGRWGLRCGHSEQVAKTVIPVAAGGAIVLTSFWKLGWDETVCKGSEFEAMFVDELSKPF
jgi:hypothetical protein